MKGRKRHGGRARNRGSREFALGIALQHKHQHEPDDVFYSGPRGGGYIRVMNGRRWILKNHYTPPYEKQPDGTWKMPEVKQ